MKFEKKIVALCICALAIGLATVLPLAYFTPRIAGAQGAWSEVDILYANVIPNAFPAFDGTGSIIDVVANFTLTSDAINFNGADAKIDVYNFHVYSDEASIANITYCFTLTGNVPDPNGPNGANTAIMDWGDGFWTFADGTKYNVRDVIGDTEGGGVGGVGYFGDNPLADPDKNLAKNPYVEQGHYVGHGNAFLAEAKGEKFAQALTILKDAKTIYIDATRVMTITYHHQANNTNAASSITTTFADNSKVIDNIKLSKTDFGFASGPVPEFMLNNGLYTGVLPPGTTPPPTPKYIDVDIY